MIYNYTVRRSICNKGDGSVPLYVNVDMKNGETANTWIDSLQAAWATIQVSYISLDHFSYALPLITVQV